MITHCYIQKKNIFNINLYKFYSKNKRILPWRDINNPYYVFFSEFMLQQTQVNRVIPIFNKFITIFPTLQSLAQTSLDKVIELWNGLGYNKRANYLFNAAKTIYYNFNGIIPNDYNNLINIKGLGSYSAKAIVTYSYNIHYIFTETNIRTVFLVLYKKYFLQKNTKISEIEFELLVNYYCDQNNTKEWYYAMMDFGSFLKKKYRNQHIQKSKAFTKQSKFQNSFRQLRGNIIKIILQNNKKQIKQETLLMQINDIRIENAINSLIKDNLLFFDTINHTYSIPNK